MQKNLSNLTMTKKCRRKLFRRRTKCESRKIELTYFCNNKGQRVYCIMTQNINNMMRKATTTTKATTTHNPQQRGTMNHECQDDDDEKEPSSSSDNNQLFANEKSNNGNKDNQTQTTQPVLEFEKQQILPKLTRRQHIGSLRKLTPYYHNNNDQSNNNNTMIDFSSNDYLGLAQSKQQHDFVQRTYANLITSSNTSNNNVGAKLGSTGSRLLTGDSIYATQLEQKLANYHQRPSALLCNSGYDANLSVMSCLTINCYVLIDELCHNSIQMGLKLSKNCIIDKFKHNNTNDLELKLQETTTTKSNNNNKNNKKPIIIVVESIYSMDGDEAPLIKIFSLALKYNACVIVDEAHGLGVFGSQDGMGVLSALNLTQHPSLLATIYTFGKGPGCHGAVICCSQTIKSYLINYGRPIIYSTSLPQHSLVAISCSYETMRNMKVGYQLRNIVFKRIRQFRYNMSKILLLNCTSTTTSSSSGNKISLVQSYSPIQALIIPGNNKCIQFCNFIYEISLQKIKLYPIRSPTVPKGQERVRIIIHSHNTYDQVDYLTNIIQSTLIELGFLKLKNNDDKKKQHMSPDDPIIRSRL